jgi:hypothetical protein
MRSLIARFMWVTQITELIRIIALHGSRLMTPLLIRQTQITGITAATEIIE